MNKTEADLCKENDGLVYKIARSFYPSKSDLDDYVQVGRIGLIRAIRAYKPERGKLSTLAHRCITNELIRYTNKNKIKTEELETEETYTENSLLEVFDCITDEEKRILLLRFESGYTFKGIASLFNTTYNEIKRKYRRALKKIKQ